MRHGGMANGVALHHAHTIKHFTTKESAPFRRRGVPCMPTWPCHECTSYMHKSHIKAGEIQPVRIICDSSPAPPRSPWNMPHAAQPGYDVTSGWSPPAPASWRTSRQPCGSVARLWRGWPGPDRSGRDLGEELPGTAFVSPHAPDPCSEAPIGRQWFPLHALDPHELARGVDEAAPILARFLDLELERHNLGPDRLALVGFSQGGMMALQMGLHMPKAPAGIIAYSSLWSGIAHPPPAPFSAPPPVLLVHGGVDEVIPSDALFRVRQRPHGRRRARAVAPEPGPAPWH